MTDFTDAIAHKWPDYTIAPGVSPGCSECASDYGYDGTDEFEAAYEAGEIHDEGSFSWRECESCGSTLGGDRHDAHAIHNEAFGPDAKRPNDVHHISICTDCLLFHANGDEPEIWEAA